jgi:hypothetical protein
VIDITLIAEVAPASLWSVPRMSIARMGVRVHQEVWVRLGFSFHFAASLLNIAVTDETVIAGVASAT